MKFFQKRNLKNKTNDTKNNILCYNKKFNISKNAFHFELLKLNYNDF